jgi:hypothetical protein
LRLEGAAEDGRVRFAYKVKAFSDPEDGLVLIRCIANKDSLDLRRAEGEGLDFEVCLRAVRDFCKLCGDWEGLHISVLRLDWKVATRIADAAVPVPAFDISPEANSEHAIVLWPQAVVSAAPKHDTTSKPSEVDAVSASMAEIFRGMRGLDRRQVEGEKVDISDEEDADEVAIASLEESLHHILKKHRRRAARGKVRKGQKKWMPKKKPKPQVAATGGPGSADLDADKGAAGSSSGSGAAAPLAEPDGASSKPQDRGD